MHACQKSPTACPRKRLPQRASGGSKRCILQEIEGNPLDAEDIAMFEMFEREGWDHERRAAHISWRKPAQLPPRSDRRATIPTSIRVLASFEIAFAITDPKLLDKIERRLVAERDQRVDPRGSFDLAHLRAIHRHLFQDVYDWAGELRTVEINKGGNQFQFRQYIPTGMADVHRRLTQCRFLRGLSCERIRA